MQSIHGIIITDAGSYVSVSLRKNEKGWQFVTSSQWESQNEFKTIMLRQKGVGLGLPSHWISAQSEDYGVVKRAENENSLIPCTLQAEFDLHTTILEPNLLCSVPDDAFLCSVPIYMGKKQVPSFFAIYHSEQNTHIGVVINKELRAVFKVPLESAQKLFGHLGRIERYWTWKFPDEETPTHIFLFQKPETDFPATYTTEVIELPIPQGEHPETILKSTGVAFCTIDTSVPRFSGPSEGSRYRKLRTSSYILSMALVVLALLVTVVPMGLNAFYSKKLTSYKQMYKNILAGNQEVKKLLANGEGLANKTLRLEKTIGRSTRWSEFLQVLGEERTKGLYFERFGSEPISESDQNVRIALAGWSSAETVVTDLIKKIEKIPYISNVALSSLEQDEKRNDIYRFKVLCKFKLVND